MHYRSRLPALRSLSGGGLGGLVEDAFSPQRLASMGWSAGGGAANALFARTVLRQAVTMIPVLQRVPGWALGAASGFVLGNIAHMWNPQFASGLVGHAGGVAFDDLMSRLGVLSGFGLGRGSFSPFGPAQAPDQLAPLNVQVQRSRLSGALTEIIPQGGIGGFGATVQSVQRQPGIHPSFMAAIS